MGGSSLGAQAIYGFLKRKLKKILFLLIISAYYPMKKPKKISQI